MKSIYIIDEHISSQKNGIGTFLNALIHCLHISVNRINLISFNADTVEFCITEENQLKKFHFPIFKRGYFTEHSKIIDKFFRLYISDSSENIFFLNHSPCVDIIKSLKKSHPNSKVIFTIHDFGWTNMLLGDEKKYAQIINSELSKLETYNHLLQIHTQEMEMYNAVDKIICLSKNTHSILKSIYKIREDKISLVPNGLEDIITKNPIEKNSDSCDIRFGKRIGENEKILLFIGRPTKAKGIFDLIEAFKQLLKTQENIKLIIIGDGNEVEMKDLINASSDIASSVIYTGQLNRKEVMEWLEIADIGIISSYYEQCSYTAIEMLRHGLPIVASDGLGIRNMLIDNVNAIIANIGNRERPEEYQENLKNAIAELLDSSELCKKLSINARKTYENRYHIRHMRQRYQDLIELL